MQGLLPLGGSDCACLCKHQKGSREESSMCVQAKAMLNAVNALPQLEQADKLIARMPPAKWAADMHTAASESREPPSESPPLPPVGLLPVLSLPHRTNSLPFASYLTAYPSLGLCLTALPLPPQPPPQHSFLHLPYRVPCLPGTGGAEFVILFLVTHQTHSNQCIIL